MVKEDDSCSETVGDLCKKAHDGHLVCTAWAGARPHPTPRAASLYSPPERMAGTRLPILEHHKLVKSSLDTNPLLNLLSVECQTPNLDQHVRRCSAGFTQDTADRRKHFWAVWVVPAKLILMAMCNPERNVPSFIYIEIIIDVYNHVMETCRDQHKLMRTVCLFWCMRKVHLSSTSPVSWILTVPKSTCPGQGGAHGQELMIFSSCKIPIPSSLSSCLVTQAPNQKPGKARIFSYRRSQWVLLHWTFCGFSMYFLDEKRSSATFPTGCEKPKFSCRR